MMVTWSAPSHRREELDISFTKKKSLEYLQKNGNYAAVPNSVFELYWIDTNAKLVYAYLHSRQEGWKCSRNNIAKNLRMNKRTISRALEILHNYNMVKVSVGRNGIALSIELIPVNEWNSLIWQTSASSALVTGVPDALVHPVHRSILDTDQCIQGSGTGASSAPHPISKKVFKKEKSLSEEKTGRANGRIDQ